MRYSKDWEDYELIDCSSGYKLERWTREILVRPDPQVIWKSKKENKYWFQPDATYLRSRTGGGRWQIHTKIPSSWQVKYKDLTFNIKTMGFKHTGIFPEQAVNWDFTREVIKKAKADGREVRVLNLFAYTGGATVACLKEGASVVHVDASRGMVQWAKENAAASEVNLGQIRWIVDDCIKFVHREIRRGNKYDIVILDPPSYGRGPKGEIWHLEDSIYDFVKLVEQVLSDKPLMVMLNSYTTGLSASVMKYILDDVITDKRGGKVSADEIGIPVSSNGRVTVDVLKNFNLTIEKGSFVAILGHNGSGKSTTAKLINGINIAQSGEVIVDGQKVVDDETIFDIRRKVGMVFQNPDNQIVSSIVEEDVAFGVENLGVEPKEIRKRVDNALKTVGMYEYRLKAPNKLSGGQKQRVAVAGIIAMKPMCIVLDEPTAMLDPSGRKEVLSTIKKLNKEDGITIVLITHYMDEAVQADRVVVMDGGEIKLDDTPQNVFSKFDEVKSLGLDVPQSTELIHRLGLKSENTILNADDCVEFLKKTLEAKV